MINLNYDDFEPINPFKPVSKISIDPNIIKKNPLILKKKLDSPNRASNSIDYFNDKNAEDEESYSKNYLKTEGSEIPDKKERPERPEKMRIIKKQGPKGPTGSLNMISPSNDLKRKLEELRIATNYNEHANINFKQNEKLVERHSDVNDFRVSGNVKVRIFYNLET